MSIVHYYYIFLLETGKIMDIDKIEQNNEESQSDNNSVSFKTWVLAFPVTALCILISIALFILVSFSTYFENLKYPQYIREYLAYMKYGAVLNGPAQQYLWEGQVWRLFINIFQHGSLMHIVFNLCALAYFGNIVEKYVSSFKYLLFIIFCGICQSIICQLTIEKGAIGLSGVIYGLFGILYVVRKNDPLINSLITKELVKGMFAQLFIFMILTYFDLLNIANVGHVSGLIYGILFALSFYNKPNIIKKASFVLLNILIISGLYYIYKPSYDSEWQKWQSETTKQLNQSSLSQEEP